MAARRLSVNMRALSIRQPWAWLILHGGKDIENRSWATKVRGRVLVHAGKGCTLAERLSVQAQLLGVSGPTIGLPPLEDLARGGIVGSVEIVDCLAASDSPWFMGPFGFQLRDPRPLPFLPWKGQLGFFHVQAHAHSSLAQEVQHA